MASVVVNATPVVVSKAATIPPFNRTKPSLVGALEIRAAYRLCGTLFMIGNGARMDALDLIDDARCTYI